MIAFLQLRNEAGGPSAYLALSANPLYLANIGIYTAQILIGDSFMARIYTYSALIIISHDVPGIPRIYCMGKGQTSSMLGIGFPHSKH